MLQTYIDIDGTYHDDNHTFWNTVLVNGASITEEVIYL
jgi:hypothetical protein